MRCADNQVETLSVLATACPPAARICATTDWAGVLSAPSPWTEVPMSLTTTRAPAWAAARASARPIPPPAPVMIATLPSKPRSVMGQQATQGPFRVSNPLGRRGPRTLWPMLDEAPALAEKHRNFEFYYLPHTGYAAGIVNDLYAGTDTVQ
eukprot:gene19238-38500_t